MKPILPCACAALLLAACADSGRQPLPAAAANGAGTEPAATAADAAVPDAAKPCGPDQATVFACSPEPGLTLALCGSPDGTALQYRETGPAADAGAAWPDAGVPASQAFASGTLMYSGGGGAFLRFEREGRIHTVYTGIGRGWEKAGMLVQEDGRTVRDLACRDEVVSSIGPELFERAAIPADASGFEIP